jgi:ferredoxin-NADP reductase
MARLVERRSETTTAHTLVFEVAGWPGHVAGQHVDVRLTAEDGYSAQRSYSLAAPTNGPRIELTVQVVRDGEVSPFLADELQIGDSIEVRGPVGGWFVWPSGDGPDTGPVLLVAGGSGVVPLMAMVRARGAAGSRVPFRLIYSTRTPDDVYYRSELRQRIRDDAGLDVAILYSRTAALDSMRPPGRVKDADLAAHGWPAEFEPRTYVCGPTPFVETVADLLVDSGHDARTIRAERYGSGGGER